MQVNFRLFQVYGLPVLGDQESYDHRQGLRNPKPYVSDTNQVMRATAFAMRQATDFELDLRMGYRLCRYLPSESQPLQGTVHCLKRIGVLAGMPLGNYAGDIILESPWESRTHGRHWIRSKRISSETGNMNQLTEVLLIPAGGTTLKDCNCPLNILTPHLHTKEATISHNCPLESFRLSCWEVPEHFLQIGVGRHNFCPRHFGAQHILAFTSPASYFLDI
jgi:hypothetical protein